MNIPVSTLITRGLFLSDKVKSRFLTDLDKHDAINDAYGDVYEALLDSNDDYFVNSFTGNYTGTVDLPDDFSRLRSIDFLFTNGVYRDVPKYPHKSRNDYQVGGGNFDPHYRIENGNVLIKPDNVTFDLLVKYYPQPLKLVSSTIQAWVTSTAYTIGQIVSNSTNYYVCTIDNTSGTFATDLAAGKWSLYAGNTAITALTYPTNLVFQIMEYSAAIEFRRRASELDKIGPLQVRLNELWERYTKQIVRDDDNYERINNHYGIRFGSRWR